MRIYTKREPPRIIRRQAALTSLAHTQFHCCITHILYHRFHCNTELVPLQKDQSGIGLKSFVVFLATRGTAPRMIRHVYTVRCIHSETKLEADENSRVKSLRPWLSFEPLSPQWLLSTLQKTNSYMYVC